MQLVKVKNLRVGMVIKHKVSATEELEVTLTRVSDHEMDGLGFAIGGEDQNDCFFFTRFMDPEQDIRVVNFVDID